MDTTMDRDTLGAKLLPELQQIAQTMGVEGAQKLRKAGLIDAIVAAGSSTNGGGEAKPARAKRTPKAADADEGSTDVTTSTTETTTDDDSDTDDDRPARRDGTDRPANADRGQDRGNADRGNADRGNADRGPRDGANQDRDDRDRRRRPSREERRRQREERRVREEADRAEEIKTAPSRTGILDILPEGYGFLRTNGYLPGPDDVYVSLSHVRKHQLRKGDTITGKIREPKNNEKYPALLQVESVNDMDPEAASTRPQFDKLTPLFPNERFRLENGPLAIAERIVDMVSPIGKGQRGMVVAPPKAGKTTILKQIANGILKSSPETHVIVLLVDERPEEVTDWQRTVTAAEVVYSTFDKPTDQHIQITELVLERSKRLAEMGHDVAIMLDNLTRLTRAYNLAMPASGKILTGGIDSAALYPPRRFFGAARNIEEGGSITIIASALVETGSRMDEGIFEEFKGTGNMELRLDRQLAEKRLFPAINVDASSTRKEELLLPPEELALVIRLRRVLHALDSGAALELLIDKLRATKSNEQFLKDIAKAPTGS
ncbi:MAG TPA: transcription termination factor Rho [Actinomycetota bacterium]|jgi:transcription termination factor Rho|nr:transcription termination factor Rho [Actinomycetota bacterium]